MNAVNIYNQVFPTKADRVGLRQFQFEKLHGEKPSSDEFHSFGSRGYVIILIHGKAHKSRSEQVITTYEGISQDRGSTVLPSSY